MSRLAHPASASSASFGEALRAAREFRGLSQVELAQRAGGHHSAISMIENNRVVHNGRYQERTRGVTSTTIANYARVLQVGFTLHPDGRWSWQAIPQWEERNGSS